MNFNFFDNDDFVSPQKFDWRLTDENSKLLKIEDVQFAFVQAEKQLEGTVNESAILLSRTMVLLTLMIGFTTSLLGYVLQAIESENKNSSLISTATLAFVFILYQLFPLLKNLRGHKYATPGSEPALLLDEYYLIKIPEISDRQVSIYLSELKSYQKRIYSNKLKNAERWEIFNNSLDNMAVLPFYLMSCYIIVKIAITILF